MSRDCEADWDRADPICEESADEGSRRTPQRDKLIAIGLEARLWRDADFNAYATIPVDSHNENHPVRGTAFRRWLISKFGERHRTRLPGGRDTPSAPGNQAIADALQSIEAAATQKPERMPAVRLGRHNDAIYLDLGSADWRVVRIDQNGWEVLQESPVPFLRANGMRPLPCPQRGGGISDLAPFLNVASDADRMLVTAWLVAALRPEGPFVPLILNGEQGSCKSTACRILRRLIDPNVAELRAPPRDEGDIIIAAKNSWIVAYDNLSVVSSEMADALCRLATGAALGKRKLYSDSAEELIQASRPVLANGIPSLATRPDLADRAIVLNLPPVDARRRQTEAQFWAAFNMASPGILGALLDGVATALRRLPTVMLSRTPRMADFATFVEAAAPAFGWAEGEFLDAYQSNRDAAVSESVDADAVAIQARELIDREGRWSGTATELLNRLLAIAPEDVRRERSWPKDATRLSNRLRRAAPNLRALGYRIDLDGRSEGRDRARIIRLEKESPISVPSVPSVASVREEASRSQNGASVPVRAVNAAGTANAGNAARPYPSPTVPVDPFDLGNLE
ncbi:hypothetical protein [Desertibaculum subflavum]|uniref:hypothetical protein n=1 Tax=Desertibaculum subflavum TaxID=2268458 RepID=UPI000E661AA7